MNAAGDATVRVEGFGCGGVQTGSGFIAGSGLVVTNAHVVAGIRSLSVYEQKGQRHRAITVYFDSKLDLAVLRTAPIGTHSLAMLRTDVGHGAAGAVLGYPGGSATLQPGPAAVLQELRAVGPDIYGHPTQRNVYQLQATIRQGNSGGPFVRRDGTVLGVIFAASTNDPHIGYALTSSEVASRVDQARDNTVPVDTKSCAA
jgi:S1-C subfamily serine protease